MCIGGMTRINRTLHVGTKVINKGQLNSFSSLTSDIYRTVSENMVSRLDS